MRDLRQQIDEIRQKKQSSVNISIIQGSPFTADIATVEVPKKVRTPNIAKFSRRGIKSTTAARHI